MTILKNPKLKDRDIKTIKQNGGTLTFVCNDSDDVVIPFTGEAEAINEIYEIATEHVLLCSTDEISFVRDEGNITVEFAEEGDDLRFRRYH